MRCIIAVDLGSDVRVARVCDGDAEMVAIGADGSLCMPLAIGRDADGAWLVGEAAAGLDPRAVHVLRELPWDDADRPMSADEGAGSVAELAAHVVDEAVTRATAPDDEVAAIVVATPTACSPATASELRDRLLRQRPSVRAEVLPAAVVAAESLAVEDQVPQGSSVLVIEWRAGLPVVAELAHLADGYELLSAPVRSTGLPLREAIAANARGRTLNWRTALLVGEGTELVLARHIVSELVPDARFVSLDDDAVALAAARRGAVPPGDAPQVAPAPHPVDDERPMEKGGYCKNGHRNDPSELFCTTCGISILQQRLLPRDARTSVGAESPQAATDGTGPEQAVFDDDVQFTVYRPRTAVAGVWERLLAFAHKSDEVYVDGQQVDPVEVVRREAAAVLGEDRSRYVSVVRDSDADVPRGGTIRFVPDVAGVEFDPPMRLFRWLLPVHREEFLFRAAPHLEGTTAHGLLSVYLDTVLIADVTVSIKVNSGSPDPRPEPAPPARTYRKVFPSYSHLDADIVESVGRVVTAFGDEFLRDVDHLRSGERWSEQLEGYIRDADVFQLYWSHNSMVSPHVTNEWRYALTLNRPGFIRPIFWERPRPTSPEPRLPPEELDVIHFSYLPREVQRRHDTGRFAQSAPLQAAPSPAADAEPYPAALQPTGFSPQAYGAPSLGSPPSVGRPPSVGSPPSGGGLRRRWLPGAAAAVVAAALVIVVGSVGLNHRSSVVSGIGRPQTGASSTVAIPPISGFPTTSPTSEPSGPIIVREARVVVARYLDDINAQDRADAQTLVCLRLVDDWKRAIDGPRGDFTVRIIKASFLGSTAQSDSVDLRYSLQVKSLSSAKTGATSVIFTVIDEGGLKICGER